MGITSVSIPVFYAVSQVECSGDDSLRQCGHATRRMDSLRDIMSPSVFLSLLALGVFPFAAKKRWNPRAAKVYRRFKKPKRFDYNLIVIGGGSAGLVSAYIAAAAKAKVLLIEKQKWEEIVSTPAAFPVRR